MGLRVCAGAAVVLASIAAAGPARADAPPGEAARIVGLMSPTVTGGSGGTAGVLVREAGSATPVVAADNATPFEPASAMKILLATAMERRVAAGAESYSNTIDAFKYPSNPSGLPSDSSALCPVAVDETPANLDPVTLPFAQTQMMQVSDNRMTRAMLLRLGGAYTPYVTGLETAAGMTRTTLTQDFVGCGNRDGKSNQTTLDDMSRLYAAIDTAQVLDTTRRDHLYTTMNRGTWGADTPFGRMIAQEAARIGGLSNADVVNFRSAAFIAFKGGSYRNEDGTGRQTDRVSNLGMQRIPFTRPDLSTDPRTYTVGTFLDGRVCPTDCYQKVIDAAASTDAQAGAYTEAMRSVVRDALLSKRYPKDAVPVARLQVADPSPAAGRATAFDATGSTDAEGPIASYAWDFGDGGTATGGTPSHTFPAAGTYLVSMGATDRVGKNATVTQSVTVGPATAATSPDPVATASPSPSPSPSPKAKPTLAAKQLKLKAYRTVSVTLKGSEAGTVSLRVFKRAKRLAKRPVATARGKRVTTRLKRLTFRLSRQLEPGRYVVVVALKTPDGRTASRMVALKVR